MRIPNRAQGPFSFFVPHGNSLLGGTSRVESAISKGLSLVCWTGPNSCDVNLLGLEGDEPILNVTVSNIETNREREPAPARQNEKDAGG